MVGIATLTLVWYCPKNLIMKTELKITDAHSLFQVIFHEYQAAGVCPKDASNNDHYDWHERIARMILEKYPNITRAALTPLDFGFLIEFFTGSPIDEGNENKKWNQEIEENIFGMSSLLQTMVNVMDGIRPIIIEYQKPSRSTSPQPKAYWKIGHNKLNIGPGHLSDYEMAKHWEPYI